MTVKLTEAVVRDCSRATDIADVARLVRSYAERQMRQDVQWGLDPRYLIRLCDFALSPEAPASSKEEGE